MLYPSEVIFTPGGSKAKQPPQLGKSLVFRGIWRLLGAAVGALYGVPFTACLVRYTFASRMASPQPLYSPGGIQCVSFALPLGSILLGAVEGGV